MYGFGTTAESAKELSKQTYSHVLPITSRILRPVYLECMAEAAEPDSRLLDDIRKFREGCRAKYGRNMTDEEKRMLDYAEKLLKSRTANNRVTAGP